MSHRNARLTVHGRRLLVRRVREGHAVAHVAKAMGVSRQCAHRGVARHDAEGDAGLEDRSSRPHSMPTCTRDEIERKVFRFRSEGTQGRRQTGSSQSGNTESQEVFCRSVGRRPGHGGPSLRGSTVTRTFAVLQTNDVSQTW